MTKNDIEKFLTEQVDNWERLGHPALMERFVLRHGKVYQPRERIGRKQKARQCFGNSTRFVMRGQGTYVEGFAMRTAFAWPFHHAWVTIDGGDAMDPTLDADEYEYYGIAFDRTKLNRELVRNEHYGLLDYGYGINARLIFEIDPELKAIVESIREKDADLRRIQKVC